MPKTIASIKEELKAFDLEVIVVDDGSTDRTAEAAAKAGAKVLRNPVNAGKGYSVKRGVLASTGDRVVFMDADGEISPASLTTMLSLLDSYDVVVASKRHPKAIYDAPLARRVLSAGFSALTDALVGTKVRDTQTGLKAFRGPQARKLMSVVLVKRYAFDVELLAVANLMGLRIAEVPAEVHLRRGFSMRAIWGMLVDLLAITYRLRVTHYYSRALSGLSDSN
ncbi:glycosyltransferase [Tardisphaera miroshnichenkoae]